MSEAIDDAVSKTNAEHQSSASKVDSDLINGSALPIFETRFIGNMAELVILEHAWRNAPNHEVMVIWSSLCAPFFFSLKPQNAISGEPTVLVEWHGFLILRPKQLDLAGGLLRLTKADLAGQERPFVDDLAGCVAKPLDKSFGVLVAERLGKGEAVQQPGVRAAACLVEDGEFGSGFVSHNFGHG